MEGSHVFGHRWGKGRWRVHTSFGLLTAYPSIVQALVSVGKAAQHQRCKGRRRVHMSFVIGGTRWTEGSIVLWAAGLTAVNRQPGYRRGSAYNQN